VLPPSVHTRRALPIRVGTWVRGHRRSVGIGAALLLALAVYPWAVGGLAAHLFATRVSERLGRTVTVAKGRAGLGKVTLTDIRVAGTVGPPLLAVERMVVPFGAALGGRGPIVVAGARAHVVRGGTDDNVTSILDRLHRRGAGTGAGDKGGATPPGVIIEEAELDVRDRASGISVTVKSLDGQLIPGETLKLRASGVEGMLALTGDDQGPRFGAEEVNVLAALAGLRPIGFPGLRVKGGYATPLPTLSLTGIAGVIAPPPTKATAMPTATGVGAMTIDLHGSYGGAREALWTAKGHADLERHEGALSLRAEQFSLDKIADVLPRSVLRPANTSLDAAFDVSWAAGVVSFGGDLAVVGVSLQHDALASEPVENVSLGLAVRGTASLSERRLVLERLEARVRDLTARLSGTMELPRGTYRFANGRKLGVVPKLDLALVVPRLPCAKLLESIPSALTPRLEGFVLKGFFEAQVGAKIDFADLAALDLRGKVGIAGCKVVKAPDGVKALAGTESIVVNVEVPPPPGPGATAGDTETLAVIIGPENPDFAPYDQISPYLINSIMTTEDNGFFKHHGWVTSEFKSALRRNLVGGGFRLGASSITMQMVKNVLLSQEKTLSRKLQELFLVWYLEQELPKERILELYFNAIEFGPRLYGIGAAARHYFGKKPSELTPLEAAFFSSILPSPKRRYVQYCHGVPFPPWDKYIRRILAKVHERGRLTDDEYVQWAATPLVFDRKEASFTEKQCLDWVKTITARPEAEVPPELDEDADQGGDAFSAGKLRRLFARGARRGGAAPPKGPPRSVAHAR
jgi:hypothetical protein